MTESTSETTSKNVHNSTARNFGRVAVLAGGDTPEREASLVSAKSILDGLLKAGVDAHLIDIADYPLMQLRVNGFDRAFINAFGGRGENGELQSLLEHLRIPYTGSRVLASAIGSDKWRSKLLWRGCGLPVAPGVCVQLQTGKSTNQLDPAVSVQIQALGFPLFVKPNGSGSSIGTTCVHEAAKLSQALDCAFQFDSAVLVEKFLQGTEFTVAIVGDRVFPSLRIQPVGEFYNVDEKAVEGETKFFCPSGLDSKREVRIQRLALDAWKAIGGRDLGRVDLILDNDGFWLLEANTSPGMCHNSLLPIITQQAGWSMSDLMVRVLELAD